MNLKLYSAENSARKAEAAKRLNYYHDAQLEYLEAQLDELFADPSKMLKVELNIVKKVINSLGIQSISLFSSRFFSFLNSRIQSTSFVAAHVQCSVDARVT